MSLVEYKILKGHAKTIWSLQFSSDGKFLSSCSSDKTTKVWEDYELFKTLEFHSRTCRYSSFSKDNSLLAVSSFDSNVSVWKFEKDVNEDKLTLNLIDKLEGHQKEVKGVSWYQKENIIASCGRDRAVWIWELTDIGEYECLSVLNEHVQDVKFLKWNPARKMLLSCSFDECINVWVEGEDDWVLGQCLKGHSDTIWQFDFNKSGTMMASVGTDKTLILWKLEKNVWKEIDRIKNAAKRTLFSVSWSHFNDLVAIGSEDNSIKLFKIEKDKLVEILHVKDAHQYDVNSVVWHPLKNELVSCADDKFIKVWKYETKSVEKK